MKVNLWNIRTGQGVIEAFNTNMPAYMLVVRWPWGEWRGWIFTPFGQWEISLGQISQVEAERKIREIINGR